MIDLMTLTPTPLFYDRSTPLRTACSDTYDSVVGSGRSSDVDDADAVVPRSSPLEARVAVRVRAVAVSHVVLPRAFVHVAIVVDVPAVTHSLVLLPAACQLQYSHNCNTVDSNYNNNYYFYCCYYYCNYYYY